MGDYLREKLPFVIQIEAEQSRLRITTRNIDPLAHAQVEQLTRTQQSYCHLHSHCKYYRRRRLHLREGCDGEGQSDSVMNTMIEVEHLMLNFLERPIAMILRLVEIDSHSRNDFQTKLQQAG
jgi:hypothetical protein